MLLFHFRTLTKLPITKQLLIKNAKVYVATRDRTKSQAAIEKLEKETGKLGYYLPLDLADLDSVRTSADEFKRHVVLFNKLTLTPNTFDCAARNQSYMCFSIMRSYDTSRKYMILTFSLEVSVNLRLNS